MPGRTVAALVKMRFRIIQPVFRLGEITCQRFSLLFQGGISQISQVLDLGLDKIVQGLNFSLTSGFKICIYPKSFNLFY